MKIVYSDYQELPAPLHDVAALLRDPDTIAGLIPAAERLGELWRFGAELYSLEARHPAGAADSLGWTALPAGGVGPRLDLRISLHDALISTHIAVAVELELPGPAWPWRGAQSRAALRGALRSGVEALSLRLRALPVPAPLALPVPVPVPAGLGAASSTQSEPVARDTELVLESPLAAELRARYPLTVEHFLAMGALDHLERVVRLERGWEQILSGAYDESVHQVVERLPEAALSAAAASAGGRGSSPVTHRSSLDYDLIYAGGGLGLLHATVMAARYGYRVMVFDRSEVGCAHREWNISREELAALVELGVVSWDELADVVMREYRDGVVRFYNRLPDAAPDSELWMPEVLNVALDAGALLRLMRRKLEAAGGQVRSGRAFRTVRASAAGPAQVEVELENLDSGGVERYRARLLLDGMGSTSPLALKRHAGRPFAGVCPTVGTVAAGFAPGDAPDEYDPTLGDILVSVADAQRGEQLMWEGFPGRDDELTVYLFYYSTIATAGEGSPAAGLRQDAPRYSLLDLFEQYFTLLPSYKRPGPDLRHVKPVYGYIPARHSLRAQEAPLLRGVLPVGDSAAQQSPLTFCGFGSHVRNLGRTTGLLDYALRRDLLGPGQLAEINAFQVNVSLNWVFSRFMHPWGKADDVNRLQNIFLEVLDELGVALATRFFRDRMRWSDYHPMIFGVLRRFPQILPVSLGVLGPQGMLQWALDYLRFSASAAGATAARAAGPAIERALYAQAERAAPAGALRLRAAYAEWRAMGWV
jgi:lycopene cyclase CruA